MSVNISQIGSTVVAKNSGNKDNGTLRVCVASDDVNLANINTQITNIKNQIDTIQADIDTIKNILNDVWNDGTNTLRVSLI